MGPCGADAQRVAKAELAPTQQPASAGQEPEEEEEDDLLPPEVLAAVIERSRCRNNDKRFDQRSAHRFSFCHAPLQPTDMLTPPGYATA